MFLANGTDSVPPGKQNCTTIGSTAQSRTRLGGACRIRRRDCLMGFAVQRQQHCLVDFENPLAIDHQIIKRHFRRADPILAEVIRRVGPMTLKPERDRFKILVRSIISQQISTGAAHSIRLRLEERLMREAISPDSLGRLSVDELRAVGISRPKAGYLLDLAQKCGDGSVRLARIGQMSDEQVIEELIQVRGIGRWSAQMFLIFALGRPTFFRTTIWEWLRRNPRTLCTGRTAAEKCLLGDRQSLAAVFEHRKLVLLAISRGEPQGRGSALAQTEISRAAGSASQSSPPAGQQPQCANCADANQNQRRRLGNEHGLSRGNERAIEGEVVIRIHADGEAERDQGKRTHRARADDRVGEHIGRGHRTRRRGERLRRHGRW